MGDAKSAVHAQAAAASMALNLQSSATATTNTTPTKSAPPTPHLGPAAPVPQLSPTPGGRMGRRLHTKVLDELKGAASRKSPALNPNAAPAGSPAAPLPSPLNLHALSSSDAPSEQGSAMLDDAGSPRIPAPPNGSSGKSKTCGICERSFTVFRAKHTCKMCGRKICDDCSKNRVKLHRRLERRKGSRLCDACARDHIQLATPQLSPSQAQIPEDADDNTDDDSGRGGGDAAFALGGRRVDKTKSTNDITREGFHRASSAIFRSSTELHLSTDAESFLRPRHWASFAALLVVLVARLVRFKSASIQVREDANAELIVEARGFVLFLFSLTSWIDHIASLRVIGSYVLGLVAYDEFTARSERKLRQRRAASLTTASNSAPSLIASAPHSRRSRTRSALSESARSTAGPATTSTPATTRQRADEDEVLEVEVGDKTVDDGLGFSYDKLQSSLTDATVKNRASDGGMKMSCFLAACDNVCGFILVFGRATAFAASTVTGYMSTITTNLAAWPVPASANGSVPFSWKEQSVRAVVLREVELHVAAAGGKKKPSCSRCVLRLLWFIEFVEACMRYTLIENSDEHCAAGASKAYEETIGARHPWIIRKGVNSALGSLPSRSAIISSLNLHEMSPEDTIMHLKKVQANMRAMLDEVTALLKEHNLLDIK